MSSDGSAPQRKPATLYDVASLAGVSHQTVSRLVNGRTNIRPDLRVRVEAAITELGYQPNLAARSLATSRSNRIGVLFFDRLDEVGPTRSVQGASDRARETGYLLDIVGVDPSQPQEIEAAIALLGRGDVAGILVFASTDSVREAVERARVPVPVSIESDISLAIHGAASTTNSRGGRLITEHLADLGHRSFFAITGPLDSFAARQRNEQLHAVLAERGLHVAGQIEGDWSPQSGYDAALRMPLDAGITALVAANDQMALGALSAMEERGISVPDQLSVVGFDDIPESRFFHPALTTVRQDFAHHGRLAFERLLARIDPQFVLTETDAIAVELVVRSSSAAPRKV